MKLLLLITFYLSLLSLYSCSTTPDMTKKEVYTILNEIIADDSLNGLYVCITPVELEPSTVFGFTTSDVRFIKRQKIVFHDFKFEPNNLKFYDASKKKFIFMEVDTSCNGWSDRTLSFPLISANRLKVVFKSMYAGVSGEYVYVKENGKWKLENIFNRLIGHPEI